MISGTLRKKKAFTVKVNVHNIRERGNVRSMRIHIIDLTFNVEKDSRDGSWKVSAYNISGGREFITWYGYPDKQTAIDEFRRCMAVEVYDPETKLVYPQTKRRIGRA